MGGGERQSGTGSMVWGVNLGHASPLGEQAGTPHLTLSHMIITVEGKGRGGRGRKRWRVR